MSKRALRRHHRTRVRAKTLRIVNSPNYWDEPPQTLADPWVYRRVENFTVCSCPVCGNPRRHRAWSSKTNWAGRTRQEHLADLALQEQLEEDLTGETLRARWDSNPEPSG